MICQCGALTCPCKLCFAGKERDTALKEFFEKWKSEPLVLLKWIGLQVRCMVARGSCAVRRHEMPCPAPGGKRGVGCCRCWPFLLGFWVSHYMGTCEFDIVHPGID